MALQGIDINSFLEGTSLCDKLTRNKKTRSNPSALLALMWHHATKGRGAKDMVILPYKDRLQLLTRYLQQIIMESLGKEKDLSGSTVNQGIAVYGNKGATDQHAYVQQLRDGVNNFFGKVDLKVPDYLAAIFLPAVDCREVHVLDQIAARRDYVLQRLAVPFSKYRRCHAAAPCKK